jgi:hypothetical protein
VAKKKSKEEIQAEMRSLSKPSTPPPPPDLKKQFVRIGIILGVVWLLAIGVATFLHTTVPYYVALALTVLVAGVVWYAQRMVGRQRALGEILQGADTKEGRQAALEKLTASGFKDDDVQAVLARAQLEVQDDPRKALTTLEKVNLDQTGLMAAPMVAQVRAMRAMIHLQLGEVQEGRKLVDGLDLSKQQDAKLRAMFATIAGEAWARSGQAQKAKDALELFNPDDDDNADLKMQMWRARAFAYAHLNDMKGVARALKKLAEVNPQLLGMFLQGKKMHPLLEREAKQMVMKLGLVPTKMVQQRRM